MDPAAVGVAQQEDDEERIDEQDIFDGVVLFLAAITCRLCSRVLGTDDPPFRPVMGKRGEAGAAAELGVTRVRLVKSRNSVGRDCRSGNRKPAMSRASYHCLVMSEAHHTRKKAG